MDKNNIIETIKKLESPLRKQLLMTALLTKLLKEKGTWQYLRMKASQPESDVLAELLSYRK